ncbi:MAG: hypothetical protein RL885_05415 [Planctomycetota bacterium]
MIVSIDPSTQRHHLPAWRWLLLITLGLVSGCGLLSSDRLELSQREARRLDELSTLQGEVFVLERPESCEAPYEQVLREKNGRVWSFLNNEGGNALRTRPELLGKLVRVRAWTYPSADFLDVHQYRVIEPGANRIDEPSLRPEGTEALESLSGRIVCIACFLARAEGGANAQCNLFADHEHGLLLENGSILSLVGDPSGEYTKGWDLRRNPNYLGKHCQIDGYRVPRTKLFIVEDVRLMPSPQ